LRYVHLLTGTFAFTFQPAAGGSTNAPPGIVRSRRFPAESLIKSRTPFVSGSSGGLKRWGSVTSPLSVSLSSPGGVASLVTRTLVLPLDGELTAIIERRLAKRRLDCLYIFHRSGQPIGDFRKAWKTACKAIGLPDRIVHDLRRSGVKHLIDAGNDPHTVMAFSLRRQKSVAATGVRGSVA
jgi:hypothetical protein